jgi:predicted P-loop ATPase
LPQKMQRRFVMIGTTNRSQFLIDPTGNRRFMPLEIASGFLVPWRKLASQRDRLWSAAVAAYKSGQSHQFTSGEIALNSEYIQQFNEPDAWLELIANLIKDEEKVEVSWVLRGIGIEVKNQTRRETTRVHDCLQNLGWRRFHSTQTNEITGKRKSVRLWLRPTDEPLSERAPANDF